MSTRHAVVDTAIGPLTVVRDDHGLTGIYFPGHWTRPDELAWGDRVSGGDADLLDADLLDADLLDAVTQVHEYLAGARREFDLTLNPHGTARARQLWTLLSQIPYGRTTTYGALAAELGGGVSARAVGGFVGHNPISIVVPCHRVVGATGKLTGYAGGLERKEHLLALEGAVPAPTPALF